jgi:hypothetical protein
MSKKTKGTKRRTPHPRAELCAKCDQPILEGASFCGNCGAKVERDKPGDSPRALKQKSGADQDKQQRSIRIGDGRTIPIPWILAVVGALGIGFIICLVAVFTLTDFGGGFFNVMSERPGDLVSILETREQILSSEGGVLSFGEVDVTIPEGMVEGDVELVFAQVDPESIPVSPPDGALGETFALEWEPGSRTEARPMQISIQYDESALPNEVLEEDLTILKFDGIDWMRIPTSVDPVTNTVYAEINHFCLFSLADLGELAWEGVRSLASRPAPDTIPHDVNVTGQVSYTVVEYVGDINPKGIPASHLRYALIDSDAGILHEGALDADGGFQFTLKEGKDVGFDLEIVLRVYAEDEDVGAVVTHTGPARAVYAEDSPIIAYDLPFDQPGNTIPFGNIVFSEEKSGAFNILNAMKLGHTYLRTLDSSLTPDPAEAVWCCSSGKDYGTTYDIEDGYLYLSQQPQRAYDTDLVLRMYGLHVLHGLYNGKPANCEIEEVSPTKRTNTCNAFVQGWGYFFSSLVRDEPSYETYENQFLDLQESYNLENEILGSAARYPGTVMTVLWDLYDAQNDGEDITVPKADIFYLLKEYGIQVDSITSFYNFWTTEYETEQPFCLLFAEWDIVEPVDCGPIGPPQSDEPEGEQDQDGIVLGELQYGDVTGGELASGDQEVWRVQGHAGDVVTIEMWPEYTDQSLDPFVILIQEWDDRVAAQNDNIADGSLDAMIYRTTLPEDGSYLIIARAGKGSGNYLLTIYREDAADSEGDEVPSDEPSEAEMILLDPIAASAAPGSWTITLPEGYSHVEIASYGAGDVEEVNAYGGWKAWLKVNGETVYDWVRYEEGNDAVYHNYLLDEDVYGRTGRGEYLDVTRFAVPGTNEITFYHYTEGDGIGVKIRVWR